eukprot:1820524-Pyramimonas_sp.AAC.2
MQRTHADRTTHGLHSAMQCTHDRCATRGRRCTATLLVRCTATLLVRCTATLLVRCTARAPANPCVGLDTDIRRPYKIDGRLEIS